MFSAGGMGWFFAALAAVGFAIQVIRYRRKCEKLEKQYRAERVSNEAAINGFRCEVDARDESELSWSLFVTSRWTTFLKPI